MRTLALALLACVLSSPAFAQDEAPPLQCRATATRSIDFQACLNVSPPGSAWRTLALVNLASEAVIRHDYAAAVRYYDEARPPAGQEMYSDITFHTLRAAAYWHVERRDEALWDARVVMRMLRRDPSLTIPPSEYARPESMNDTIYAFILPILQTGDRAEFETALAAYEALPSDDWVSYANRAAVLLDIGQQDAAVRASELALIKAPDEPPVLNNHCAILTEVGRAQDALPFCERAVAGAPDVAAVRDSLSDALAALGRCDEAEREIAEARRLDPSSPNYARPIECSPVN